jgi:hypothetical protein
MMAMTRPASMTPDVMSSSSPDASDTVLIGTLRTSMGSGTVSFLSWVFDRYAAGPATATRIRLRGKGSR